ncbi:hypothetical protein FNF29_01502 [Cafeteria roenbergensis]|uniref:Uncharacterized protein n=1 Tax=Cafeteria roenbergensis TaxID=33653 RepID=A0A5A8CR87_CAFRO|nr:hypothetical protein FNF29_01502 [Cafeteria roenbergensis]|eukprot:KAA0155585.1 hypothetical protein FNF29_01502 [Cafeteria roenbergensis]
MAAADEDAGQVVAELAVAVVLRILSPAMTTQPQVLMDRAFAVLVNHGSDGKPAHSGQSEWGSLLRAITRWGLLGIPREAAVSANAFGRALEAEGVGPFGAAVATAMARAVMLSAAIVDPQMFDSIVAEAVTAIDEPMDRDPDDRATWTRPSAGNARIGFAGADPTHHLVAQRRYDRLVTTLAGAEAAVLRPAGYLPRAGVGVDGSAPATGSRTLEAQTAPWEAAWEAAPIDGEHGDTASDDGTAGLHTDDASTAVSPLVQLIDSLRTDARAATGAATVDWLVDWLQRTRPLAMRNRAP